MSDLQSSSNPKRSVRLAKDPELHLSTDGGGWMTMCFCLADLPEVLPDLRALLTVEAKSLTIIPKRGKEYGPKRRPVVIELAAEEGDPSHLELLEERERLFLCHRDLEYLEAFLANYGVEGRSPVDHIDIEIKWRSGQGPDFGLIVKLEEPV